MSDLALEATESAPLVSIAVVNWNGERFLHRCLESAFAVTHRPIEVIVVDNGSTDGSLDRVKARYGDACRYIENATNLGYSPAMNQGDAAARGEFLVQLNLDACLAPDFVTEGLRRFQEDDRLGMVGARVYQWAGDELTQTPRKGEGGRYYFRKRFQLRADEQETREVANFGPASCVAFLRVNALRDVETATGYGFDERFVTGWEDTDLWFRMQLRGWTCRFVPSVIAWHVGSGSAGGNATFFTKDVEYRTRILRNRLYIITKNLPAGVLLRLLPHLIATEVAMIPYFLLRSPSSVKAFFGAWKRFLADLPNVLAKRRRIQHARSVSPAYVLGFFERP